MTTPTPEPYFCVIDDKIDNANINHSFYFSPFLCPTVFNFRRRLVGTYRKLQILSWNICCMALTLKSDFYSPNFCSFTCTCICFWGNYISVRFFEIDIFYNEAQLLEYIYISCFKTSLVRMTRFFKPCRSMWKGILKKMKILLVKMLVCEHTRFYWEWFLEIFVTGIKLFPLS